MARISAAIVAAALLTALGAAADTPAPQPLEKTNLGIHQQLGIPRQKMEQKNWCWATVIAMIMKYYAVERKQCQIATDAHAPRDPQTKTVIDANYCCEHLDENARLDTCARGANTRSQFFEHQKFTGMAMPTQNVTPEILKAEIDAGRPVISHYSQRYSNRSSEGHAVLVVGYAEIPPSTTTSESDGKVASAFYVAINDPAANEVYWQDFGAFKCGWIFGWCSRGDASITYDIKPPANGKIPAAAGTPLPVYINKPPAQFRIKLYSHMKTPEGAVTDLSTLIALLAHREGIDIGANAAYRPMAVLRRIVIKVSPGGESGMMSTSGGATGGYDVVMGDGKTGAYGIDIRRMKAIKVQRQPEEGPDGGKVSEAPPAWYITAVGETQLIKKWNARDKTNAGAFNSIVRVGSAVFLSNAGGKKPLLYEVLSDRNYGLTPHRRYVPRTVYAAVARWQRENRGALTER